MHFKGSLKIAVFVNLLLLPCFFTWFKGATRWYQWGVEGGDGTHCFKTCVSQAKMVKNQAVQHLFAVKNTTLVQVFHSTDKELWSFAVF